MQPGTYRQSSSLRQSGSQVKTVNYLTVRSQIQMQTVSSQTVKPVKQPGSPDSQRPDSLTEYQRTTVKKQSMSSTILVPEWHSPIGSQGPKKSRFPGPNQPTPTCPRNGFARIKRLTGPYKSQVCGGSAYVCQLYTNISIVIRNLLLRHQQSIKSVNCIRRNPPYLLKALIILDE